MTALVSGVSIWVNSHAVKHVGDATVYTTAKNGVAGLLLLVLVVSFPGRARETRATRPATPGHWLALLAVAVIGGSVPFVLFFEGLARAQATQASFIQKTMIVWVALLAVPLLRERFRWPHALAICLLIAGQAWIAGSAGTVVFGSGEAMILAATLLWAAEVVLVKQLLPTLSTRTLATARMGLGTLFLVGWVVVDRQGRAAHRPRRGGVALGAPDRAVAERVRRDLVRRARARAGDRRHGRARVRGGRHRPARPRSGRRAGERDRHDPRRRRRRGDRGRCATATVSPHRGVMSDPAGPLLFARYAYPPNSLGLCGADTPRTLLEYGAARASDGGLAELARTFDGAWPYLRLIADANAIADPLDARVVEAYWVGNALLDQVQPAELARHVDERFRGRIGRAGEHVVDVVAAGAKPHHCFHVFAVYPWLGLLRTGVVSEPLRVLDQCRTAPALVLSCRRRDGRGARAAAALGRRRAAARTPGAADGALERRAASASSRRRQPGEWVSLHWDFVCDGLSPGAARSLARANRQAIAAVNAAGGTVAALN